MKQFIIHAGYPKTASEFLRKKIFSHLDDVLYLDKFYTKDFYCNAFAQGYHTQARNSSLFIPEFGDFLLERIKTSKKDIILISSVDLISYYRDNDVELNMIQLLRLFRYLHKHGGKIKFKVMMTIRNQKDALKSSYSYHRNLNFSFNTFRKFIQYGLKNKHELLFGGYHYNLILEDMRMLYGSDNVQFFVYERMNENVKLYLQDILNFIGTKHNIEQLDFTQKINVNSTIGEGNNIRSVTYGPIANLILKIYRYNKKVLMPFNNAIICKMVRSYVIRNEKIFIKDKLKHFPEELIHDIDNLYRNSNQKLSIMLGTDLEKYGYIGGKMRVD